MYFLLPVNAFMVKFIKRNKLTYSCYSDITFYQLIFQHHIYYLTATEEIQEKHIILKTRISLNLVEIIVRKEALCIVVKSKIYI